MMNRKMMKQAQQLQKQMVKMQEELEEATVEASVGGGVVKVVVSGKMKVESITIEPEAVSPDDVEMLQDLVLAAVNEGLEKAQAMASDRMGAITGGLNIPGLT
ncbi:MAG: YbaB/EbfC family nucleoid-associated protein [Chloroflexi bacterium]|nr:YbaB/EbfC family nucleoid-associated protein [Chloroflexota bacterium]MCH8868360.1 YbaB/EbfC family nucleoid-associated protein [Chloroflexota bacterium]MCI0770944.1 YbaB/EbfC family nucleoid-associated protein [Chloroflexota bacterium]MCI0840855.1 YbaB/EbfC family nucleoid-associated protein [Chloroflexota bacterium]MCI0868819.1 YbaB/EbfC family nucleoid-associated protein [Chloroflexota bacterium]